MANIDPNTPKPLDEAYPRAGHTEIDPRATGATNPQNPGFATQGYQGQGMAAPRYDAQIAMENDEEE